MRLHRRILAAATLSAAVAATALGLGAAPARAASATATQRAIAPLCRSGYYKNVSGHCVLRPTRAPSAPAGATARCRDATYSFSEHASGTCSHHGGVAVWIHHP